MSFLVMNEAELMTDDIGNTIYRSECFRTIPNQNCLKPVCDPLKMTGDGGGLAAVRYTLLSIFNYNDFQQLSAND